MLMKQETIQIGKNIAQGYEIPVGPVNLVFATTGKALIGCGLIDVTVFDKFNYPAAKLKATQGPYIVTVGDLLDGEVREANATAQKQGVKPGLSGRQAMEIMARA
jgi:uncharacterized protein YunC (DUF1805 family)